MSYILFLVCTNITQAIVIIPRATISKNCYVQYTSLNLSLDICSKIMATVTFYTLILNLLYTNHIILHTLVLTTIITAIMFRKYHVVH